MNLTETGRLALGALVLISCATGCSSQFEAAVRVVDAETGQPIPGALVHEDSRSELSSAIYWRAIFGSPEQKQQRVHTDARGMATLDLGTNHVVEYGARAWADGYEPRRAVFSSAAIDGARKRPGAPVDPDLTIPLRRRPL